MKSSDSIIELLKAFSIFQGALENVAKDKAGHGYKYATLGACIDAAKPVLAANGLSVMQLVGSDDKGTPTMNTILGHSSGEFISTSCDMPIAKLGGGGGGNPAQVMGASITYMRRYQYAAIIGLAQDDTDGAPKAKVNMELEAVIANREDHVWVSNNWGGAIKNQWSALSQDMTDVLNNTFNEAKQ
tara:strand:+ start:180 stop:737 length:558 start_codon:yes stop_codon:yes gene_type:complete